MIDNCPLCHSQIVIEQFKIRCTICDFDEPRMDEIRKLNSKKDKKKKGRK
jgi:hypothetical protein